MTTSPLIRQSPPPPPPPPPAKPGTSWTLRPGLILLAVACAGAVWALQRIFVQSARGQGWDEGWRLDVEKAAGLAWETRAHDFGMISLRLGLLLCVVLAVVALARRRVDLFVRGAIVVAGANATTQILKHSVIERPDYVGFGPNALPSGHTTLAFSVVIAALIILPAVARPYVAVVGGVWAFAMGASTIVSGWHRPSDAVAAGFVCAGWAALVAAVQRRR